MEIPYDTKANITTYLSVSLIPILVGAGFTEATANIIIGIIALVLVGDSTITKFLLIYMPPIIYFYLNIL